MLIINMSIVYHYDIMLMVLYHGDMYIYIYTYL